MKKLGSNISLLLLAPFLGVLTVTAQSTSSKLADVTSVFIQADDKTGNFEVLGSSLRREFQVRGFDSAESGNGAPVLSVFTSVILTLDGGPDDTDIMVYDTSLMASDGTEVWKYKLKFATKWNWLANHAHAAKKIAERFKHDWLKAKKRPS